MKVLEEMLSEEDYKNTKAVLYEIRTTTHSYELYDFFKRILYVSAHFAGSNGYIDHWEVISSIRRFLKVFGKAKHKLEFSNFKKRAERDDSTYFVTSVDTILNGSWGQLIDETKQKYKEMCAEETAYRFYVDE